jgi:hypothetical protein
MISEREYNQGEGIPALGFIKKICTVILNSPFAQEKFLGNLS